MTGSGDDKRMRDLTEAEQRRKTKENRPVAEHDDEAARAAAAAQQAKNKLDSLGPPTVPADLAVTQETEVAAETPEGPPRPSWRVAAAIVLAVCVVLGWFATTQSGSGGRVVTLRLDTDAEGFARRAATADFQDSSRRRVSPSAIQ